MEKKLSALLANSGKSIWLIHCVWETSVGEEDVSLIFSLPNETAAISGTVAFNSSIKWMPGPGITRFSAPIFSNILWIKSPRKWAKNLVDFFQISCGFSHFSARNWRKKISHSFFSTIFVGFLDKNCRFIAYKSTILVQETNKYR